MISESEILATLRICVRTMPTIFEMALEEDEVWDYTDMPLKSFFDGWDSPPLPLWLTGLILATQSKTDLV